MPKSKSKKKRHLAKHKQHVLVLTCVALAIAAVVGLAFLFHNIQSKQTANIGRLVTFYDRGQEQVILTRATTVRDALKDAEISIIEQDRVEPDIKSELLTSDPAIIIYRARPVLVIDGSVRQKVVTSAATPREIVKLAGLDKLTNLDKATFSTGDFVTHGSSTVLTIKRKTVKPAKVAYKPTAKSLTKSRGAQIYVDKDGVAHRETYYDLPMNIVINHCGKGNKYTIRPIDGAKVDKDGYILVAANYGIYPRCSIVDTSMGPGKVYDTGGFALRYPHGFDLATDWSFPDGR